MMRLRRLLPSPRPAPITPEAGKLEIIVAVCDSEVWLPIIHDYYTALGLSPLFIVDRRSRDQSLSILRSRHARIWIKTGNHPRVESLLLSVIPRIDSQWILRFDDDEAPSRALLRWIGANLSSLNAPAVGLPRQWVRLDPTGQPQGSRCAQAGGAWGADRQYRLFQPKLLSLNDEMHTPGFKLGRCIDAPAEACMYHFDWIIRSYADRQVKIRRYEWQSAGGGQAFAAYYLPEDHDPDFYDFRPISDPDIAALARRLARRNGWRDARWLSRVRRAAGY